MQLANQEAQRLNHEFIDPEHLFLGLIQVDGGVGPTILRERGIFPDAVRREIERRITPGPEPVLSGKIPLTPRAKKAIELAIEEADQLGDRHVGTEHILLGLLQIDDGPSIDAVRSLGVKTSAVRQEIRMLTDRPSI